MNIKKSKKKSTKTKTCLEVTTHLIEYFTRNFVFLNVKKASNNNKRLIIIMLIIIIIIYLSINFIIIRLNYAGM
jgi:hypothetical protein